MSFYEVHNVCNELKKKEMIFKYMSGDSDKNFVFLLFLCYMSIEHVCEVMCCIQLLGPW